jgi:outer membrane lipoprotein carrier protein
MQNMNVRLLLALGLLVCLIIGISRSHAGTPTDDLLARLAAITALQGNFEQRQFDEKGIVAATSSGSFKLLKPGYFAWEITAPDSQLVIADTQSLWHHDIDLETVTRRPIAGNEQMTPLQVLGGDEDLLRERFAIAAGTDGNSFTLVPVASDPGFRQLSLRFDGQQIVGMEIIDNLNQRINVLFSNVQVVELTPEDFAFTPPAGVDLFDYEQ